jgi:hypothetical protein
MPVPVVPMLSAAATPGYQAIVTVAVAVSNTSTATGITAVVYTDTTASRYIAISSDAACANVTANNSVTCTRLLLNDSS